MSIIYAMMETNTRLNMHVYARIYLLLPSVCIFMQDMKGKVNRLEAIKELIESHTIGNQEELLHHLNNDGFILTQATLSRDLKKLKVSKAPDLNGTYHYVLPIEESERLRSLSAMQETIQKGGISIEFSGQLAVMKTRPGYASAIAWDIDTNAPTEILGTIAGDDTVLLILRERVTRNQVIKALSAFIPSLIKQDTETEK
jgi:transcriptional regulator of arginine metabolism